MYYPVAAAVQGGPEEHTAVAVQLACMYQISSLLLPIFRFILLASHEIIINNPRPTVPRANKAVTDGHLLLSATTGWFCSWKPAEVHIRCVYMPRRQASITWLPNLDGAASTAAGPQHHYPCTFLPCLQPVPCCVLCGKLGSGPYESLSPFEVF